MERIPLYRVIPGEGELEFVSLVKQPAIMEKGLAFSKQIEMRFAADDVKGVVVGPAMIPGVIMDRYDEEIGDYAVVFDEESIEYFQEQFIRSTEKHKVNFDHFGVVESAFIKSMWLIEDPKRDKSNVYGFEYPKGTLMMEVKVTDKEWFKNAVQKEGRFGFSVEGLFSMKPEGYINKNLKMSKLEKIKLMLAELSDEEKEAILEVIQEVAEPEVAEQVAEAVVEAVEETETEEAEAEETETVEEEMKEEDKEEVKEEMEVLTMETVMAALEPKFEEIYSMLAELRNELGKNTEEATEEVVNEEFNLKNKVDALTFCIQERMFK